MAETIGLIYHQIPKKKVVRFVSIGNCLPYRQDPDFLNDGKEDEFRHLFPTLAITRQNTDLDSRRTSSRHTQSRANSALYQESVEKLIENQNLRLQKIGESYCGNVTRTSRTRKFGSPRYGLSPKIVLPSALKSPPGLPSVDIFGLGAPAREHKGQAFPGSLQLKSRQKSDRSQINPENLTPEASENMFIKNHKKLRNSQSGGHKLRRVKDVNANEERPTTTPRCENVVTRNNKVPKTESLTGGEKDLSVLKSSSSFRDHSKLKTRVIDLQYSLKDDSQSTIRTPSREAMKGKNRSKATVEVSNIQRSKTFSCLERNLPLRLVKSQKSHNFTLEKEDGILQNNRRQLAAKSLTARFPEIAYHTLCHLASKYPRRSRTFYDPDKLEDFSADTYLIKKEKATSGQSITKKLLDKTSGNSRVSESSHITRCESSPPSAEIDFNPENTRVVNKRPSRGAAEPQSNVLKSPLTRPAVAFYIDNMHDEVMAPKREERKGRKKSKNIIVCGTRLMAGMENQQPNYSPPSGKECPMVPSNTPVPVPDGESLGTDDPTRSPKTSRIEVFLPHVNPEN